ncbi:hypothetical protein AIOL_004240 [Candidatus Rhodobacter oscarellae]|uniref:YARHG domain-containing protein n=1 Tax=Candidatus Rhodobacter oscarellae TaxID=1675527 RepID=A0A0J9EC41_9RHOB|nr:hypothetical protein [Candidatus Rhodobacter lobularis]KMW59259.1 hypothetical protein AIOL_004240 [Candidatus Rhodobacter lobularis]
MIRLVLALTLALTASAAQSGPNSQLERLVQARLAHYGFKDVDASDFATPTLARLHLTLISSGSFLKKRREVKNILRTAKYKCEALEDAHTGNRLDINRTRRDDCER